MGGAYEQGDLRVRYLGKEYDVSRFRKFHPGGANTLGWYGGGRDVTAQLTETHHPSAISLLREYRVEGDDGGDHDGGGEGAIDEDGLIDWSGGLVRQVGALGASYHQWVVSPVDRKPRLFDADWLERLTLVPHWSVIPGIWLPVCACLLYVSHVRVANTDVSTGRELALVCSAFGAGLFIWPVMEYSIHRWLFHLKPPDSYPSLIAAHFILHGLHHKVPFDERRLLFPPAPFAVFAALVYSAYSALLPPWAAAAATAGTLAGYVTYDLIHYYLHYGSPKEGTYLYFMKRYHNQHHFVHHNHGFGISSHIWDKVFNTGITLKKLNFSLKW